MDRPRTLALTLVAAAGLAGLFGAGTLAGAAQEATETPAPAGPAETPVAPIHPVALHQGTCQEPTAEPAYDLGSTAPFANAEGTAIPREEFRGTLTAPPLLLSSGQPEVALDDLLDPAQPYVVIVHQSPEQFDSYLACGEVGGPVVDDELVIGLRPLNNSGYAGTATFTADGDTTTGTVYLMSEVQALSGGQAATPPPAETPTPAPTFAPTETPTPAPTNTPAPTPTVSVEVTATPAQGGQTPTPAG